MSAEHVATMVGKSPMGRLGEPAEVAELVMWLCSDACSFNTGAVSAVVFARLHHS